MNSSVTTTTATGSGELLAGSSEILDESVTEVARLVVDTVKEKLSICSVTTGNASSLAKGMGVMATD